MSTFETTLVCLVMAFLIIMLLGVFYITKTEMKRKTDIKLETFDAISSLVNYEVCDQCKGEGKIKTAFPPILLLECDLCEGLGFLDGEKLNWRKLGREIKARRIAAQIGMRQAAENFNMKASDLSKMERGCICPANLIYPQKQKT